MELDIALGGTSWGDVDAPKRNDETRPWHQVVDGLRRQLAAHRSPTSGSGNTGQATRRWPAFWEATQPAGKGSKSASTPEERSTPAYDEEDRFCGLMEDSIDESDIVECGGASFDPKMKTSEGAKQLFSGQATHLCGALLIRRKSNKSTLVADSRINYGPGICSLQKLVPRNFQGRVMPNISLHRMLTQGAGDRNFH